MKLSLTSTHPPSHLSANLAQRQRAFDAFRAYVGSELGLDLSPTSTVKPAITRALYGFWEQEIWPSYAWSRGSRDAWQTAVMQAGLAKLQRALGPQWQPDDRGLILLAGCCALGGPRREAWEAFCAEVLPPHSTLAERLMGFRLWQFLGQMDPRKASSTPYRVRGKRHAAQLRRLRQLFRGLAQIKDDHLRLLVGSAAQQWWCRRPFLSIRAPHRQHPQKLVDFLTQVLPHWFCLHPTGEPSFGMLAYWLDLMSLRNFELAHSPEAFVPNNNGDPIDVQLALSCFFPPEVPAWLLREYGYGVRGHGQYWQYRQHRTEQEDLYTEWLPRLVRGQDLRQVPRPGGLPFTRRMVRCFFAEAHVFGQRQAPEGRSTLLFGYLSLRQVGASADYAYGLSRLLRPAHLRADVLRFLARSEGEWDTQEQRALLHYLHDQLTGRAGEQPLRLKQRSIRSVRQAMAPWLQHIQYEEERRREREAREEARAQGRLAEYLAEQERQRQDSSWPAQGYAWSGQDAEGKSYQVVELTCAADLRDEGGWLKHCVGGYARRCVAGTSRICSLRLDTPDGWEPVLTLQINDREELVQARGLSNRRPTAQEESLIRTWAEAKGISVKRF